MTIAAHLLLFALALPATVFAAYLLLLTLLSRAPPRLAPASRSLRFDIVVPAHNEALGIAGVVGNLQQLDWPPQCFRILVIADNCDDATAALARAAGAEVLERFDTVQRGKGHALAVAFRASKAHGWAQAVVVVDADTEVSANLLEEFAALIRDGASAMQAHYGVLNAGDSWRTRLLAIAMSAFHRVRSRARARLGLSCGIRGNGWCITHQQLQRTPYQAFSLTEDIEFGITLGLAGQRVFYTDEAEVVATMVSGEQAARTQRQRWEGGRWRLIRLQFRPLLRAVLGRGSPVCADLLLDLLVPPLAYVAMNVTLLVLLGSLAVLWQPGMQAWLWLGIGCALALALHVLRGWQLSGTGGRGLLDLAHAPFYVLWKMLLMLRTRAPTDWVRTRRESP